MTIPEPEQPAVGRWLTPQELEDEKAARARGLKENGRLRAERVAREAAVASEARAPNAERVRCSAVLALSARWRDRALEIEERVKRCVERGSRGSFQMSYAKAQMLRNCADEIETIGRADQANDQDQRRVEEKP